MPGAGRGESPSARPEPALVEVESPEVVASGEAALEAAALYMAMYTSCFSTTRSDTCITRPGVVGFDLRCACLLRAC